MSLPGTTMIYAVYWPERNVLKVGRAWKMSRLRGLMETGGRVLLLMRDCPLWEEQAALSELRLTFVRAFATEQEGSSILPRGRGFTECFRVAVADLEHAVKTIFRGIARHDYQLNAASAAGHSDRAASEHVACGSALDRDRVADVRRRSRSGGSRPTSVAVSDLARRSTHHDVNGGGSRLGAGRGGVCRNLRRGGGDAVRSRTLGEGFSRGSVVLSAASSGSVPEYFQICSGQISGCGERGGECERECGRGRGCGCGAFRYRSRSIPVPILFRASSGNYGRLQKLWHRPPSSKARREAASRSSESGSSRGRSQPRSLAIFSAGVL